MCVGVAVGVGVLVHAERIRSGNGFLQPNTEAVFLSEEALEDAVARDLPKMTALKVVGHGVGRPLGPGKVFVRDLRGTAEVA